MRSGRNTDCFRAEIIYPPRFFLYAHKNMDAADSDIYPIRDIADNWFSYSSQVSLFSSKPFYSIDMRWFESDQTPPKAEESGRPIISTELAGLDLYRFGSVKTSHENVTDFSHKALCRFIFAGV